MSPEDHALLAAYAAGRPLPQQPEVPVTGQRVNMLAELLLGLAPGSGEVMAAQDSVDAGREGWSRLRSGNFGGAASSYADSVSAGLGALPLLGVGIRGVRKGAGALADALRGRSRAVEAANGLSASGDLVGTPQQLAEMININALGPNGTR